MKKGLSPFTRPQRDHNTHQGMNEIPSITDKVKAPIPQGSATHYTSTTSVGKLDYGCCVRSKSGGDASPVVQLSSNCSRGR